MQHDSGDKDPGCEVAEFYRIVRVSYSREEMHEFIQRTNLAVRVAKCRGLIPWDYDGEREATQERFEYDWPSPPQWGEAA